MVEIDWGDFKVLLALSRGGSVAGAARLLGVDSSTISRRLAAMEQAVGACLVLRGGRDFAFTAEGKTALSAAEAMETMVVSAVTTIHSAKTAIEGVVRISSVPSLIRLLMPLVTTDDEMAQGLDILRDALAAVSAAPPAELAAAH